MYCVFPPGGHFRQNNLSGEKKKTFFPFPRQAIGYLEREGVVDLPGGFPTSLVESGQQWDFPNGWAPLQHMVIEGAMGIIHWLK